jgi:hypothetical protein
MKAESKDSLNMTLLFDIKDNFKGHAFKAIMIKNNSNSFYAIFFYDCAC